MNAAGEIPQGIWEQWVGLCEESEGLDMMTARVAALMGENAKAERDVPGFCGGGG